jgi:hypothetical protein
VREVRCEYCSTITHIPAPVERVAAELPARASRAAYVAVGAALAAGVVSYFALRAPDGRADAESPLPSLQSVTARSAIAPAAPSAPQAPKPELPEQPTVTRAPEPRADIEPGRVTLLWTGKVRVSTGAAPRAGSPCTLTARVTSNGERARRDLVSIQCGGQVLYDSSLPLEGMSNNRFGVGEQPISGEVNTFQYVLEAQDVGPRAGPKSQFSANSRAGVLEVFRHTAPSFHLSAALGKDSQIRRGRPLLSGTVPPFAEVVRRTAKVVSRSGAVPFTAKTCKLVISPAYATGNTCRVTLSCQGKVVYGAGTYGYNNCLIGDGQPTSFVDATPTPTGGDPQLQADLAANTASLGDTLKNGASYLVQFALSP